MSAEANETRDKLVQLVSFRLGSDVYAIDILRVQEIRRMIEITKVPQVPSYCEGVINLRGEVITVIDLRTKFGLAAIERDNNTRIVFYEVEELVTGLIVDAVEEVLRIPISTIEPALGITPSTASHYIRGVVRLEDRLLLLLDISKIAAEAEVRIQLAGAHIG